MSALFRCEDCGGLHSVLMFAPTICDKLLYYQCSNCPRQYDEKQTCQCGAKTYAVHCQSKKLSPYTIQGKNGSHPAKLVIHSHGCLDGSPASQFDLGEPATDKAPTGTSRWRRQQGIAALRNWLTTEFKPGDSHATD